MIRPVLVAAAFAVLPAFAQPTAVLISCGRFSDLMTELRHAYHEEPVSEGLIDTGNRLVIFASPNGESFTVAVVQPNGFACVSTSGEGYEPGRLPVAGRDS